MYILHYAVFTKFDGKVYTQYTNGTLNCPVALIVLLPAVIVISDPLFLVGVAHPGSVYSPPDDTAEVPAGLIVTTLPDLSTVIFVVADGLLLRDTVADRRKSHTLVLS